MGPGGGGTSSFTERNAVGQAIRDLPSDQVTADLNAVAAHVAKLPAAGFVFYGTPPMTKDQAIDKDALARIKAPVHGFYAGNDARINAILPPTIEAMKELKKTFDPVTYEGSEHGFMRAIAIVPNSV